MAMSIETSGPAWRIGVDIGGTFTDVVLWRDGASTLRREKLLTTPEDPSLAVIEGVQRALDNEGVAPADLASVIHGTTLVANALIERRGVKTGLITTSGFRDVLEIGREWRYDLFDLNIEMPTPLVPRALRQEAGGRLTADGSELTPLDEDEVAAAAEALSVAEVQSVAVSLLHSYRNPAHERRVGEIVARVMPDAKISLSSDVSPELGEYERTSTTVANAYVLPIFATYVDRLVRALAGMGYRRDLLLVLSDGRCIRADVAMRYPIRLVQSGPAAGAEAARLFGELAGESEMLCFDMGGTTAKACLIHDGEPERTAHFEVARETRFAEGSGLPLQIPAIDMIEIGAGGGSIASIDARGLVQVGPKSAGADPGPACYGRGNDRPTVTDCDLILGYLDAGSFLAGKMALDVAAAEAAIRVHLAEPLGISLVEAAWGVHETVTANMAQAASIHAIERGLDATRFAMMPIGGAGPVHACDMATKMNIDRLICPIGAGVASAIGMLAAPVSFEVARAAPVRLAELDVAAAKTMLSEMSVETVGLISGAGVAEADISFRASAMMRYVGQGYEIEVPVEKDGLSEGSLADAFAVAYGARYGRTEAMASEILSWRVVGTGPRLPLADAIGGTATKTSGTPPPNSQRPVYFESGFVDTPVHARRDLLPGHTIAGPAIIEEDESTLVVPPDFDVSVDEALNLIALRKRAT
ncbi:MAG: hydantoinase/oxoprolinase family protein [Rhodospirillaceae bacterium]|nr:hydantoinase/oxoprolinase family protein [Rhodospirillaceae bacterium]